MHNPHIIMQEGRQQERGIIMALYREGDGTL